MSKRQSLSKYFPSNKRKRPTFTPTEQPESSTTLVITSDEIQITTTSSITFNESQIVTTSVITLDDTQIVTTSEINDDSLRKKSKHHENETLTNKSVQALAKNDIGLFINIS